MKDDNFIEVYRAKNNLQALVLRHALDDAGIRAMVEGELLQGAVGELPIGWATAPRILVAPADFARARQIIAATDQAEAALDEKETGDNAVCLACGGRMPDGVSVCAACGWSYGQPEA